jgi:hypothetical protein
MPRGDEGLQRIPRREQTVPDLCQLRTSSISLQLIYKFGLMPAEGFEPPTNGLQNRCSTTELSRHRRSYRGHGMWPQAHGLFYQPCLSAVGQSLNAIAVPADPPPSALEPCSAAT